MLKWSVGNKPYWANVAAGYNSFSYNISHHGKWVIAEAECKVGCDVMDLIVPGKNKRVGNFVDLMESSFASAEWRIKRKGDTQKILGFEGEFIKNEGVRLHMDLKVVSFARKNGPKKTCL